METVLFGILYALVGFVVLGFITLEDSEYANRLETIILWVGGLLAGLVWPLFILLAVAMIVCVNAVMVGRKLNQKLSNIQIMIE